MPTKEFKKSSTLALKARNCIYKLLKEIGGKKKAPPSKIHEWDSRDFMVKLQKQPKLPHIKNQTKTHKQYNLHLTFKQKHSHSILGNQFIPGLSQ